MTGIGIKPQGEAVTRFNDRRRGIPRINDLSAKANTAKDNNKKKYKNDFDLTVPHNSILLIILQFPQLVIPAKAGIHFHNINLFNLANKSHHYQRLQHTRWVARPNLFGRVVTLHICHSCESRNLHSNNLNLHYVGWHGQALLGRDLNPTPKGLNVSAQG
ncbi:MAG: hypothetical protein KAR47_10930, partial [Planctomycetes bacterium]|nr:hypothetical protein [Planctomycetota bacterium]